MGSISWDVTFEESLAEVGDWQVTAHINVENTGSGWDVIAHQLPTFIVPANMGGSAAALARHIISGALTLQPTWAGDVQVVMSLVRTAAVTA